MKIRSYIEILFLIIISTVWVSGFAQTPTSTTSAIRNLRTQKSAHQLNLTMEVPVEGWQLGSNEMMVVTPVLQSNESSEKVALSPIVLLGKRREKVAERRRLLRNHSIVPADAFTVLVKSRTMPEVVTYTGSVPYEAWMNNAALLLKREVKGCADCRRSLEDILLSEKIDTEVYQPKFQLTYLAPEAEPVKERSDRHSASFSFEVAKHDLKRDYKGNAAELNRVEQIIREVQANPDIKVTELMIVGHSSPEGGYEYNKGLSQRRARAFAEYLGRTYSFEPSMLQVSGEGEDWDGLYKAIEQSTLSDREQILSIIKEIANPDRRDAHLKALSAGETYRHLLNSYFPPLRRTDYTISYAVRPFSVEEAREVIKTNPKLLSLNEMYLVAQSYPSDSPEFKEVFDIAVRLYPHDATAIVNSAAVDIEGGNKRSAIQRLSKIAHQPEAWNNLAIAYALEGEIQKAEELFQKAIANGDKVAQANLEELKKVME